MVRYIRGTETPIAANALAPGSPYRLPAIALIGAIAAVTAGIGIVVGGPLLLVVALLAAVGALAMLTDPLYLLWAALAVVILLPFATLPVDVGVTPTFLEVCIVGAFAVGLFWFGRQVRARLFVPTPGWALLVFLGLAVTSFVMGTTNARPDVTSVRRFADMLLSLSLFYLVINVLVERRALDRTYRLLVALGALAALAGIGLYFLPASLSEAVLAGLGRLGYPTANVLRYVEDDPSQPLRAIGTSVDPNVFGGLLAFIGGLIAPHVFVARSRRRQLMLLGAAGLVGVALLLTFSRGSMFGLVAALGMLGVVRQRRLLWLIGAGALLVLVLPPTRVYVQHFIEGVRGQDLATQMRFGEYKDAFLLIARYPWLGVGFTGAPDVDIYLGVSSVYLLIAEEMGLLGLLVFLLALSAFFAYTWPRARAVRTVDARLEATILGTQTAVAAGMVAGVLDHYLFNLSFPHAAALLWSTVAIGVAAARLAEVRVAATPVEG